MTDKQRALQEKAKGNEAFAKGEWALAVGYYAAAQLADPSEPTIVLNRAMAYLKLAKYDDAERDCTTALRLAPNNVKALFRRGKARKGSGKLNEAKSDFEQVLQLDSSNKEAKTELAAVQAALEKQKPPRTAPIDLPIISKQTTLDAAGSSRGDEATADGERGTSSVEAARRFLQQVGMEDPVDTKAGKHGIHAPTADPIPAKIPQRLPGETGGFLREVSSKKVSRSTEQKPIATVRQNLPRDTTPQTAATPASTPSTQAHRTANALSFGTDPASGGSSRMREPGHARKNQVPKSINAVEFQRLWKEASRLPITLQSSDRRADEEALSHQQFAFLETLDPTSLPVLMNTLLEPELLASLIGSLARSLRAAAGLDSASDVNRRPVKLPTGSSRLLEVVAGFVVQLPRCQRFSMIVAMLDANEKRDAATLIHALEDNDVLGPAAVAEAHRAWEA